MKHIEGFSLTHKLYTRLEMLVMDKCSSLLRKFVNYGHKKVYNIGTSTKKIVTLLHECWYAEYNYAECHIADGRYALY